VVVTTRFVTGALLVAGAGLLSACASGTHAPADPTSPGVSTVTVTQTATTARSETTVPPNTTPPPKTSSGDSGATFAMPDEVGKVLQTAQDDLQRATHDPVFYTGSEDATGRGRHQILDRDWKVCSQNVPAGRQVERRTVIITFSVVKLAETCP
jgi:hypothetical protein